ncbi:hypothetical protein D3874_08985 [Oleomonas cavernae]|uniref:Tetratricopeptide repeat protein n=2 Tax=Oleomonas cavernae TaxID=2320859 RepID=A0A418WAZ9_9PROT|nr:hypothetical protein D3874_08985 [Oleomonas cavernae]
MSFYNQDRLDDEAFLANFIARGDLAAFLLDQLRVVSADAPAEHHLIVGPRGMGKTSLLRRVAIGVTRDDDLRCRFVPLRFREEQYNVLTLADFWRNCADALAEWCEANDRHEMATRLDQLTASPVWREEGAAGEIFITEASGLGLRPLLLVDNLDLIVDALGEQEQWALRRALQAPGGPILYGAATQILRQTGDRTAAFYEFFAPHLLEPLSREELVRCLRALAEVRGEAGRLVIEILHREPERLHTLHELTGGNPRVLAMLYRLLESAETDTVMADLEALLDQVTPYYKARVEEYRTTLQRAVIDAVALHWDPITSHDLAQATAIEVTTISPQLSRLKNDGLIEEVSVSGARSGYQLVERFLNIWYLMRHGTRRTKQRVRWLVAFLANFYSSDELRRISSAGRARSGAGPLHAMWCEAVDAAVEYVEDPARYSRQAAGESAMPMRTAVNLQQSRTGTELGDLGDLASRLETAESPQILIDIYDEIIARFGDAGEPALREEVARALVNKGITLGDLNRNEEAIAVYDGMIARFGDAGEPALREQVAGALANKGITLGGLDRSEEAIDIYDEIIARFGDAGEPALREEVARALVNKGSTLGDLNRNEEAIAVYDEVVARFGDAAEPVLREGVARALISKGIRLSGLNRSEEAIAVYDGMIARFGDAGEPALREQVAGALANKGITLGGLDRSEEAIDIYDEIIARFGDAGEPALREEVARALVNKGSTLGDLNRNEEAIAVYDEVVARFGDAAEPVLREGVARALISKGIRLGGLNRSEEAIAVYDEVVARFGDAGESVLRVQVARALINKGYRLGVLGLSEEEVAVYDGMIARFADATEPALRERVARALVNKGITLGDLDRNEEAIAVYDEVVARFGDAGESVLRVQVARALINKGYRLGVLGLSEEEVAVYDGMIARFGDAAEPALREQVAGALANKGITLGGLDRSEEAIDIYDEIIARFGDAGEPALREEVARALVNKGSTLGDLNRNEEAIAVYDEVVARFGDAAEPVLREGVARALINKGYRLGVLGLSEEEVAVYDGMIARFGDAAEPTLREEVARALVNKGYRLGGLGRSEQAIAVYDEVLARFGDTGEPALRKRAAGALVIKGNLLADRFKDYARAENAYRESRHVSPENETLLDTNLAWLWLATGRTEEAAGLRSALSELDPAGLKLLDAGLELARDNFGTATANLDAALNGDLETGENSYTDDLYRLLRLAQARGYGEKLIVWFEETGHNDRQAPVYAAFVAYVRGERFLLDFSPEVRRPATRIYEWLVGHRTKADEEPKKATARKRGRPPRRRG